MNYVESKEALFSLGWLFNFDDLLNLSDITTKLQKKI
jgi:hypothetical protein